MENHSEISEKYLVGVFGAEDVLMSAVKKVKNAGVKIHEVFTPYPIHNLDVILGYKRSRLPRAAFLFGATGTITALSLMTYMLTLDWPMIIGGKDHWPGPDFIPVSFELTVLFSALGMVFTFLVTNDLYPGKKAKTFDVRSTDDKFVMAVNLEKNNLTEDQIRLILQDAGAEEVNEKQFD
jgi:hypothetical protein